MMNPVNTEEPLLDYYQIDWSKPPPILDRMYPRAKFTTSEAGVKNYALAMNRTTLRWIKDSANDADIE